MTNQPLIDDYNFLTHIICDSGSWSWWAMDQPGQLQVEFDWPMLWAPAVDPQKAPLQKLAIRFKGIQSVSFLTGSRQDVPADWPQLMRQDQFRPLRCSADTMTFYDSALVTRWLASSQINTVAGSQPSTSGWSSSLARLGFLAGPQGLGLLVSAQEMLLLIHQGIIDLPTLRKMHDDWWLYRRDYWKAKDSGSPPPYDPRCEDRQKVSPFTL